MSVTGWAAEALEAARRAYDASFYLGMCQAHADPQMLESGTVSDEEFAEAKAKLAKAEDDALDADAALTKFFSGPTGYPMSADELAQRLSATP